jgi:hypothetical protein
MASGSSGAKEAARRSQTRDAIDVRDVSSASASGSPTDGPARRPRSRLRAQPGASRDAADDGRTELVGGTRRLQPRVPAIRRRLPESHEGLRRAEGGAWTGDESQALRLRWRHLLLVGRHDQRPVERKADSPPPLDLLDTADGDDWTVRSQLGCAPEALGSPASRSRSAGHFTRLPAGRPARDRSRDLRHPRPPPRRRRAGPPASGGFGGANVVSVTLQVAHKSDGSVSASCHRDKP